MDLAIVLVAAALTLMLVSRIPRRDPHKKALKGLAEQERARAVMKKWQQ